MDKQEAEAIVSDLRLLKADGIHDGGKLPAIQIQAVDEGRFSEYWVVQVDLYATQHEYDYQEGWQSASMPFVLADYAVRSDLRMKLRRISDGTQMRVRVVLKTLRNKSQKELVDATFKTRRGNDE